MGFAVRREQMENSIIFIDEMDLHLNTALQKTVLQEIVEHWIPDSSQLWTASHALGFIEYAQESDLAALIDLDALDFDPPQVVTPSAKSRLDLVEIAVPRESLTRLFANRTIVICEGKDHAFYNAACDDASRLFIPPGGSDNAGSVLAMARSNPGYLALRDRDFLMDDEIRAIQAELPNVRVLPFYSIENFLYHPDNIASLDVPDLTRKRGNPRSGNGRKPIRSAKSNSSAAAFRNSGPFSPPTQPRLRSRALRHLRRLQLRRLRPFLPRPPTEAHVPRFPSPIQPHQRPPCPRTLVQGTRPGTHRLMVTAIPHFLF